MNDREKFGPLGIEPWPEPVDGKTLLDEVARELRRFLVLPLWGPETLALWILHTYAFLLRDVSTYLGIESPEKQCGKTTLLTVLSRLVNRPEIAANISPPAFFRVIEETRPTLLIDEADTFLRRNGELRGILNAGYTRDGAYVVRVANQESEAGEPGATGKKTRLARFSCWCPKAIAAIGRLPETLADRCIPIRMERKTPIEPCERLRNMDTTTLKRKCLRFVMDHAEAIASARPEIPPGLADRTADIWEPLVVLADLAGGSWPELARKAAAGLTASAQENNPIGSLLLDLWVVFIQTKAERLFSRTLVASLSQFADRPWAELRRGKELTEGWLARQLRPYGVRSRTLWIEGAAAKGYKFEDFREVFRRYIPRSEIDALLAESRTPEPPAPPAVQGSEPKAPKPEDGTQDGEAEAA